MDDRWAAVVVSWPMDASVVVPLAIAVALYVRGYARLRRRGVGDVSGRRLACFVAGAATLLVALVSPIDPIADLLLSVHMVQHLLLMIFAPVLVAASAPGLPLLHGLPRLLRPASAAVLQSRVVRWLRRAATLPVRLVIYTAVTWLWHLPRIYETTLRSQPWHYAEHASFFAVALLFWWPVVRPSPSMRRPARWLLVPYLMLAALQGTGLSALIAFSGRVLYPHYASVPDVFGTTALGDQAVAGALFWVVGSAAYVIAAVRLVPSLMRSESRAGAPAPRVRRRKRRLPVVASGARAREADLSARPWLGRVLRSRRTPLLLQWVMLGLAAVVVGDGLLGPQVASMNAAGVLPWIHWRGLVVLALLLGGNLFCMACPFTLPRRLLGRLRIRRRKWPKALHNKWIAVAVLVTFLWAYEALGLWASPWWTAWITLGYFVCAAAMDVLFEGAAFCKHVCPIGQFHFFGSMVSPTEVRVRDPAVCRDCTTHECIRGSDRVPGCQMELFQPRKHGNMDCTYCLDCTHACPHDNVAVMAAVPGADLVRDPRRSGVGRFADRLDLAALVTVLVFGAFMNAGAMVGPALAFETHLSAALGLPRPAVVGIEFALGLVVLPALSLPVAAWATRAMAGVHEPTRRVGARYVRALVPLGFGMWAAHMAFHLFTSAGAALPVLARLTAGLLPAGLLHWTMTHDASPWIFHTQVLLLQAGLLGSLYVAYRIARSQVRPGRVLRAAVPWATLAFGLYGAGVWILLQPMAMRGAM